MLVVDKRGPVDSNPIMDQPVPLLSTIGYEAADLDDFIATLRSAGVRRVIDVRELAISRRKGFAKRALTEALENAGIRYVHLRGLGDPKEGRDAARAGDTPRFRRVFLAHMTTAVAQTDLQRASTLAAEGGACLLCYERDHSACHRSFVASALSDRLPIRIRHLGVRVGAKHIRQQEFAYSEERA